MSRFWSVCAFFGFCFVLFFLLIVRFSFFGYVQECINFVLPCTPVLPGDWVPAEPTGCATECGIAAGSGTPGTVKCSTESCDADTKPAPKMCPQTQDCGAFYRQNAIAPDNLSAFNETVFNNAHTCASVYSLLTWLFLIMHIRPTPGVWARALATGCATECGVAAGASDTPDTVFCSTSSCDPDTKPQGKQCPKTADCGTIYQPSKM